MADGGQSNTVIDTSQTNVDPNTAVNPNPGSVDTTDYNPTTVSQWWDTQQAVGGTPNFSTFPWGQAANAILGGGGGGMGAGLALGLGALAAALTRQQAPEVKMPEYKAAPVYNRALTAPLFPPQPAPQKSASGQNIYTPMRGLPLFFNPNPFQFDATEAAKKYGPTPEQIAQGQAGYEAGLASLYKPMSISPITFQGATGTTTGGTTGTTTTTGGTTNQTAQTAPAPLIPPPPSQTAPPPIIPPPSAGSTQVAGATTNATPMISAEDWSRIVQSGGSEIYPSYMGMGEFSTSWRDPKSGYGVGVSYDPATKNVDRLRFFDPRGLPLYSGTMSAQDIYKFANDYGVDLSSIGSLGSSLTNAGVKYLPGELYSGTGSNLGVNFADIAANKLGSAYDWTQDYFAANKGPYAESNLANAQELARELGLDLSKSENLAKISPQRAGEVSLQYALVTPSMSETPTISWYQTQQAADQAAQQYGGTVYNLGGKTIDVPGGASGGSIDDILVGYGGGDLNYYEGGDVYAAAGRYLEGPGDGMSDSITAQIDHGGGKTQPARLARGEFVVPADVVSDLGNGSSNAGAQKLYDMMKKIRKARHGTSKQPPAVKTDKAMPA